MRWRGVLLLFTLSVALPVIASAQDANGESTSGAARHWGLNVWGLSYHVNRSADYNEDNWGLGVRWYARPQWRWLGTSEDNRVFLEFDAFRNSNRGLVLPLSAAVEYRFATMPGGCKLFAAGALTLAYYVYPQKGTSELKAGPVPGLTVGCGRVRTNITFVLRKDSDPLAAIAASLTFLF